MKIALLASSYPPMVSGAALFAEKLALEMAKRSHEVLVLTTSDRSYPYRVTGSRLIVERFRSYPNPLRVSQRMTVWPHHMIMARLKEFAPDVIHIHDPLQFGLSSMYYCRRQRIPVVFTIHQLPWFVSAYLPNSLYLQRTLENVLWRYAFWFLRQCALLAAPTQTIAEVVHIHTCILPKVISCGVDLDKFQPFAVDPGENNFVRSRLGISDGLPIILHVGRLDLDKQVDLVVQAAARAMKQVQAQLVVVGDGTQRTKLIQLCRTLDIFERSHFPGFIFNQDGLPAIYRASALFVTASEIETQGIVLLEAAACGLPLVAVRATCVHEIVHSGENGLLAPPGDINELAGNITWLLQHPAQARIMGQASRRIVESHPLGATMDAYEALYEQANQDSLHRSVVLPY
jgi:1,2-diacylglycerol 3-alpha-glucosyltransferase